ncbi:transmembrane emp24 domain-containing protein, putative [Babesia caballi]|uniref:Transmembrane emp24 domain-containing protein, putative n=1 Tax=Babesia caballi TaxID=5871 RepID=A0AAV4M1E5_BABCB|nr:transmembrane emp24 domain-containing protein, putative [Babesia caballi]
MDGWYTELVGAEGAEGAAATADNEGVVPPPAAGPEDSLQRPATEDEEDDGFMDSFFDEWTEKMEGFHPSAVLSLDIAPKASEFFYEHVRKAGTLLRGMFYTLSRDEDINVRLVIRTPSGDSVYQREAGDGIYAFEAKVPGVYQFEFSNSHWMTPVGLTVQAGSDEHSVLRSAHVQGTKSRLGELKSHVDSVYAQYKFLWLRNLRSIRAAHEAQLNLLLYALVQFIVVALCSVLCVCGGTAAAARSAGTPRADGLLALRDLDHVEARHDVAGVEEHEAAPAYQHAGHLALRRRVHALPRDGDADLAVHEPVKHRLRVAPAEELRGPPRVPVDAHLQGLYDLELAVQHDDEPPAVAPHRALEGGHHAPRVLGPARLLLRDERRRGLNAGRDGIHLVKGLGEDVHGDGRELLDDVVDQHTRALHHLSAV